MPQLRQVEIFLHNGLRDPCVAYDDGTTTHSGNAPLLPLSSAHLIAEFHEAAGGKAHYDEASDTYSIALFDDLDNPSNTKGEIHQVNGVAVVLYRIGYDQAWEFNYREDMH